VERACAGRGAGWGRGGGWRASAFGAYGKAHQCRVSLIGLDPACQHHDAGARTASAPAGFRCECALATTAIYTTANAGSSSGQKAAGAETSAPRGTGPGGARCTTATLATARGFERLILLKALADR
jgi:hypothetical protein